MSLFVVYKSALHGQQLPCQTGNGNRMKHLQIYQGLPVWRMVYWVHLNKIFKCIEKLSFDSIENISLDKTVRQVAVRKCEFGCTLVNCRISHQRLCWASKGSHAWSKRVICCRLLLLVSSINLMSGKNLP